MVCSGEEIPRGMEAWMENLAEFITQLGGFLWEQATPLLAGRVKNLGHHDSSSKYPFSPSFQKEK